MGLTEDSIVTWAEAFEDDDAPKLIRLTRVGRYRTVQLGVDMSTEALPRFEAGGLEMTVQTSIGAGSQLAWLQLNARGMEASVTLARCPRAAARFFREAAEVLEAWADENSD